jgi:hypothetical protein
MAGNLQQVIAPLWARIEPDFRNQLCDSLLEVRIMQEQRRARMGFGSFAGRAAVLLGLLAVVVSWAVAGNPRSEFNRDGNILIADQFNNRVIEVTPNGDIVWKFGLGPNDFSPQSIIGCNDAQRVGTHTLMAGTGIPPGVDPLAPNGVADNRVILVNPGGDISWQYGQFGVTGSGPNQLNTPVQCTWLPTRHVLITDQANERIIEVSWQKAIVWQYGTTGVAGNGPNELNNPNSAELLDNGNILIADENNNRAIEVDRDKNIVATFTAGGTVSGVAFASRLPDGNTLITDSNNSRIVEVDAYDNVVWQYFTNTNPASNPTPLPTRALRLKNGNTIISDQFNAQVIIIDPNKNVVAQYGNLNQPGFGRKNTSQGLNAPYDAKVIGDYTGITAP